MRYKCVDELDKFDFKEAGVTALRVDDDTLSIDLSSGIAKYNNPCNTKYVDCYISDTQIRIKNPKITRFFLEGPKYYDANDVLLKTVPDRDILPEVYEETMDRLASGEVFLFRERTEGGKNGGSCEIAIDVEDDTYWLETEYEKIIIEWDRFRNRVDEGQ
ncbi:MAG: hypothetical protein LUE90_04975 [Clostridiales bacterium]|nr:hypothetical protein [Clostridiales bacterium]